jgi:putative tryptophan/tyrosine transport system substrate-binding protein
MHSLLACCTVLCALVGDLLLGALAAEGPSAGRAYQVGILTLGPAGPGPSGWWQPFIAELRQLNYVEGRNLTIMYAGAEAKPDRLPSLAADLVKGKVDIIVTTGPRETLAAKRASSSIPIVFTVVHDPVGQGVVTNLARPEGNVTGLTTLVPGFYQKYVELLREVVPSATRFAVVSSPNASREPQQEVESAGRTLGVDIAFVPVSGPDEFDAALARAKRDGAAGIIVTSNPVTTAHRQRLVQLAVKHRLPGIFWERSYVEAGGLMTYSANPTELRRRAAHYVDKILKGAKPGDLPVERPAKFELVVNLRTAEALGLTIPPSLLLRVDQVIR